MSLSEKCDLIVTKEDLANFLDELRADFISNRSEWENHNLEAYFEATAAWLRGNDQAYKNRGKTAPSDPDWKFVGSILYAGKIYE